ncbi:MAG: hypothetical protein HW399_182 [Dehalococcoidia bacterium]|nr:hypothetical protein [Dehalococcoidia bacterium]
MFDVCILYPGYSDDVARGVFQPYPKLVRIQRTNHGWTDGIYDDSLPCFTPRKGRGENDTTENKKQFTLKIFTPTLFVSHFFYKPRIPSPQSPAPISWLLVVLPHAPLFPEYFIFSRGWQAWQTNGEFKASGSALDTRTQNIYYRTQIMFNAGRKCLNI